MFYGVILKDCKHVGDTVAVIRAQCRPPGFQPAVFDIEIQGIVFEVMIAVSVLFADHVDVRLQDDGGAVFIAGTCRFVDCDIENLIAVKGQTMGFRKGADVVADRLFISGTAGNF